MVAIMELVVFAVVALIALAAIFVASCLKLVILCGAAIWDFFQRELGER